MQELTKTNHGPPLSFRAVPLFVTFVLLRANALAFGFVLIETATLLFALWELAGLSVRRNNRLQLAPD